MRSKSDEKLVKKWWFIDKISSKTCQKMIKNDVNEVKKWVKKCVRRVKNDDIKCKISSKIYDITSKIYHFFILQHHKKLLSDRQTSSSTHLSIQLFTSSSTLTSSLSSSSTSTSTYTCPYQHCYRHTLYLIIIQHQRL
jgi:CRISPR/Cas system CMR subunit Cmr6 (Cas7 group RAMP superfamily)